MLHSARSVTLPVFSSSVPFKLVSKIVPRSSKCGIWPVHARLHLHLMVRLLMG